MITNYYLNCLIVKSRKLKRLYMYVTLMGCLKSVTKMEDGEAKWTNKCLWTVNVYLAMSALQFTGLTILSDLNLFPCYHFYGTYWHFESASKLQILSVYLPAMQEWQPAHRAGSKGSGSRSRCWSRRTRPRRRARVLRTTNPDLVSPFRLEREGWETSSHINEVSVAY